jgi:DNA-binding response OmpR family regulator
MDRKILIVDDDLETLKLVGLMLQRRGYEIVAASAGSQALAKVEAEKPDLVILDIMMPDVDGYEVCQQLRSNPNTAHLPVLMFTAKGLTEDKTSGFQAGADDYLTKPIHPSELVSHVEALLKRADDARAGEKTPSRAHVIGVIGAKGGVGASTVAVNLAVAIYQHYNQPEAQQDGRRVYIADLHEGLGTVALLLGQMPRGSWTNLMDCRTENLDQKMVESQIMTHSSGVRYLPASVQPENERSYLSPEHVDAVLSRVVSTADYLLLDLGSVLDKATQQALALCDKLILVAEPDRLCLFLAQVLLDRIRALAQVPNDIRIVLVERSHSDVVFPKERIVALLGHDLTSIIKPAATVVHRAVERGEPFVLSDPESEIAGQLRKLSQALLT